MTKQSKQADLSLWIGSMFLFVLLGCTTYCASKNAVDGLNDDLRAIGKPASPPLRQDIREHGGLIGYSKYIFKELSFAFNKKGPPIRQTGQYRDY